MSGSASVEKLTQKIERLESKIAELQETEKALKEAYAIINRSPAVVFLWENAPGWPVELVSGNVKTVFGYRAAELIKKHISYAAIIHPDDLERVSAEVASNSADTELEEFFQQPYRIVTKDGRIRWVEDRTVIRKNDAGTISHFEGIVIDITDRKTAEDALALSKRDWEATFAAMADWICLVDLERQILRTNPAGSPFTGVRLEDIPGHTCCELLHGENYVIASDCPLDKMLKTRQRESIDLFKPEQQRWLRITVDPMMDGSGEIYRAVHIVRDITDLKMIEEERFKAEKLRAVGILAGGIAHDFNNLLSVILGNIELAANGKASGSEIKSFLKQAEIASIQAKGLTRHLVLFAKGSAPAKKTCDIKELIHRVVSAVALGPDIRCELDLQGDLWTSDVDPEQMQMALGNLLTNAAEAMQRSGTIYISARNTQLGPQAGKPGIQLAPGRYINISVQDYGSGIVADVLPKIFDPYFSTKTKGTQKGMGLGLAITNSIIEKHGGCTSVQSQENAGATFTLYLPAHRESSRYLRSEKPPNTLGTTRGLQRILIIDDEPMILDLCRQMLERMGYSSDTAIDGAAAVAMYKAALLADNPFDAVIIDLVLKGGTSGLQVMLDLIEIDPMLKAIVCSGYSDDPVMVHFTKYGFVDALAKPYTQKDLARTITSVLAPVKSQTKSIGPPD